MTNAAASFAQFFGRIPKAVLFGAAILIQLALLAAMVVDRAQILREGTEVKLQTRPVDPRDFLRGDYVVLGYDISQLKAGSLKDQPAGSRNPIVFVKLAPNRAGLYEAVSVHADSRRGHKPRGADPRPRQVWRFLRHVRALPPSAMTCRSATISKAISFPRARARNSRKPATWAR